VQRFSIKSHNAFSDARVIFNLSAHPPLSPRPDFRVYFGMVGYVLRLNLISYSFCIHFVIILYFVVVGHALCLNFVYVSFSQGMSICV